MTLEKLIKCNNQALKENATVKRSVLTSAISRVKNAAIDKGCRDNVPEYLVDKVLLKELKTLNEMIDTCPKDRPELLESYLDKLYVLEQFCPKLITDESEIKELISSLLVGVDTSNKGMVMKTVMPQLKGKVDMKVANKVLGEMVK